MGYDESCDDIDALALPHVKVLGISVCDSVAKDGAARSCSNAHRSESTGIFTVVEAKFTSLNLATSSQADVVLESMSFRNLG